MIEDQFLADPKQHELAAYNRKHENQKREDHEETAINQGDFENFSNNRLMTPRMKKLTMIKDAREMLQDEINESVLRLKQAKFGHSLYDIVPDHQNKFYLPNRDKYMPKP